MQKPVRMTQNYDKKNILKIKIYLFTKTKSKPYSSKKKFIQSIRSKIFLDKNKNLSY